MDDQLRERWAGLPHESSAHVSEATLIALAEGRPATDHETVLGHLARCAECRDAFRAVRLLAQDRPTGERIAPLWRRPAAWVAAAALLVVSVSGVHLLRRSTPAEAPPVATATQPVAGPTRATPPSSPTPSAGRQASSLTPPDIAIHSPSVLAMRSEGASTFAESFASAMAPWREGDYRATADRLAALERRFPGVADVPFYRGVAFVLAGDAPAALAPLERAAAIAPTSLRADAQRWLDIARQSTVGPSSPP